MRLEANTNGNGAHVFELDPFGHAEPQTQVLSSPVAVVAPQQKQPKPDEDVFAMLSRRIRERRAEVKRLQAAEAELALLEKMASAAGITVAEPT